MNGNYSTVQGKKNIKGGDSTTTIIVYTLQL